MTMRPFRFFRAPFLWFFLFHGVITTPFAQETASKSVIGTGFFVRADGYIVTAYHVIKGKEHILVGPVGSAGPASSTRPDGMHRYVSAKLVRTDSRKDLALLKAPLTGQALRITPWHDVPIGLDVYAVGYPQVRIQGMSRKITQGIINGERSENGDAGYFQLSAEIQKGNSGGPILAPDGSVVGVVRGKLNALSIAKKTSDLPQNVNYGIKSSTLLRFLQESGITPLSNRLKLDASLRAYQIYQQTGESIIVVIARHKTASLPRGIVVD